MVTGLVSVASIATFKRSLGRVPGVSTIGVASGPDGEFVFTVSHDAGIGLGEAIVALPGFEAQVTAETSGGLEVAAHDPDADAFLHFTGILCAANKDDFFSKIYNYKIFLGVYHQLQGQQKNVEPVLNASQF